jgi:IS30 family transposase
VNATDSCIHRRWVVGRRRTWTPFSDAERAIVWARWGEGALYPDIGKELGRSPNAVAYLVIRHGGIAPPTRRRAGRVLSLGEREEISRGLVGGESLRSIARRLGRAASSVSREIQRHGGALTYRAAAADSEAWDLARRPKECLLATHRELCALVSQKLRDDWSPEQISKWLVKTFPDEPELHVSHETIYRTLYVQARGALKKELTEHLRRRSYGVRRNRHATGKGRGRGQILDTVSISERPPEAADRAVPGHWEGDLLMGTTRSQIATLVERQSRYVMLIRLPSRETGDVVKALARRIKRLPESLKQSLTWDRGKEMGQHKSFTLATDVKVYFCDPQSPWQRGTNENTNGLLRQYFPRGMDLTNVTQRQLEVVARKLNTRPRETLDWNTPAEALAATVATTD